MSMLRSGDINTIFKTSFSSSGSGAVGGGADGTPVNPKEKCVVS